MTVLSHTPSDTSWNPIPLSVKVSCGPHHTLPHTSISDTNIYNVFQINFFYLNLPKARQKNIQKIKK
uniref:Uncharacterized protein n=1 Tax=viral metagenome TaxID=1070528 RepID=A0A6C0E8H7_9ZZZZ